MQRQISEVIATHMDPGTNFKGYSNAWGYKHHLQILISCMRTKRTPLDVMVMYEDTETSPRGHGQAWGYRDYLEICCPKNKNKEATCRCHVHEWGYCFARYYHGKGISMITENYYFSSYISFYSMMKVSFGRQSLYGLISSAWHVACNKFSVLKLCPMWIFNRVHGNTFPWYCWFGAQYN